MHPLNDFVSQAISQAFKRLLNEKHLYQSVEPDLLGFPKTAEDLRKFTQGPITVTRGPGASLKPPVEELLSTGGQLVGKTWIPNRAVFTPSPTLNREGQQYIQFDVPSINTFCSHCQDGWPFNPLYETVCLGEGQDQWFILGYECQQCHGSPIRFLLRREGLKLRLAGRDPIEVLPTPKALPKGVNKFYSDAQVAHHAGQTLAGIFLLRTFIEQYWRGLEPVKKLIAEQPRATGDEQGEVYQKTLPDDFKAPFPSLSELYGRLSAAMHEANVDAQMFEDCSARVVRHFEAKKLFDL